MTMRAISREPQPKKGAAGYFTGACPNGAPVVAPASGATISWWWTCLVVAFSLGFLVPVVAQPDSVFRVWYTGDVIPGNGWGKPSNLPNFYNGENCIAYGTYWRTPQHRAVRTRFPGDTAAVFAFKGRPFFMFRGDFIGDAAIDYVDGDGYVYLGVQDGMPPNPEPIEKIEWFTFFADPTTITQIDINGDGKQDLVFPRQAYLEYRFSPLLMTICMSNGDSVGFRKVVLSRVGTGIDSSSIREPRHVYRAPDGTLRLVVFYQERDTRYGYGGFELYKLVWSETKQNVEATKLAELKRSRQYPTQNDGGIFKDSYLLPQPSGWPKILTWCNDYRNEPIKMNWLDLSNDSIKIVLEKYVGGTAWDFGVLEHSVDGDEYRDWYIRNVPEYELAKKIATRVFSGDVHKQNKPVGYPIVPAYVQADTGWALVTDPMSLCSIEDINSDGVADIVLGTGVQQTDGSFFGIALGKSGPSNLPETDVALTYVSPNPLSRVGVLRFRIPEGRPQPTTLRLTDTRGATLVSSVLFETSANEISIDLGSFNLQAGRYLLVSFSGTDVVGTYTFVVED